MFRRPDTTYWGCPHITAMTLIYILQKGEQFGFVAFEQLDKPFGIFILVVGLEECLQAAVEPLLATLIGLRWQVLLLSR